MYALYALLSKKSKSHMPLPQPVLFKHVHLGEDSGMWELFSGISHKLPPNWYNDLLKTYPTPVT